MANQEQLELLKQGVTKWNAWRREHQDTPINFSGAKLSRVYLYSADLSLADLNHADLSDAYLNIVDLSRSNLSGAKLSRAYLYGANLSLADLNSADLSDAYLSSTNLSHANLSSAYINNADLSYADLNSADLSDADLSYANLNSADLSCTDLHSADLSRTNFSGANLSFADLSSTSINSADFSNSNLRNSNLSGADLSFANLSDADLHGANFDQIIFNRTLFAWVDLSHVKGLEAATHYGPSIVDINSVTLPHDEATRIHFLRGVGFTETQIEYLPSLLTPRPIEYYSLFISYAHQDDAIAKRLHTDLRKKDVPCWFAPHDLRPGTPILRGLEEAIHLQDKFLLILSKHAVRSAWIEREVDAALHQEIKRQQGVLFPVRLDDAVLESNAGWATRLQHRHIGDFTRWQDEAAYQEAFTMLLNHLKVGKGPIL